MNRTFRLAQYHCHKFTHQSRLSTNGEENEYKENYSSQVSLMAYTIFGLSQSHIFNSLLFNNQLQKFISTNWQLHVIKIFTDPGVSGAASSQNISHQQAPHQLSQAIHIPQGVTQYVTTMQRPHQVKPVSHPQFFLPFFNHMFMQ